MRRRCCRLVSWICLPPGSIVGVLYYKMQTQSSAPEDGWNFRSKHVELNGIINNPLLLHLVGVLHYYINDARLYKNQIILYSNTSESQSTANILYINIFFPLFTSQPSQKAIVKANKATVTSYKINLFLLCDLYSSSNISRLIESRRWHRLSTGLFISPSGIYELDCATTKTDTAERSI